MFLYHQLYMYCCVIRYSVTITKFFLLAKHMINHVVRNIIFVTMLVNPYHRLSPHLFIFKPKSLVSNTQMNPSLCSRWETSWCLSQGSQIVPEPHLGYLSTRERLWACADGVQQHLCACFVSGWCNGAGLHCMGWCPAERRCKIRRNRAIDRRLRQIRWHHEQSAGWDEMCEISAFRFQHHLLGKSASAAVCQELTLFLSEKAGSPFLLFFMVIYLFCCFLFRKWNWFGLFLSDCGVSLPCEKPVCS